jgi:hypothetical protein
MAADRKWSEATRKKVVEMYTKGAKLKHISSTTGVPVSTIFHILKEAGHAPQRMTRRKLEPTSQSDQVSTLEWLTSRLFELQNRVTHLESILAEYGIDPETGEVIPEG